VGSCKKKLDFSNRCGQAMHTRIGLRSFDMNTLAVVLRRVKAFVHCLSRQSTT
jgi:hypothetical protein